MILQFKITKLFGFRNIDINFDDDIKIFIGENGLGKTTVLNILYYCLNLNFSKLSKIDFESIYILFIKNKEISFNKFELESYLESVDRQDRRRLPMSLINFLRENNTKYLEDELSKHSGYSRKTEELITTFLNESKAPHIAPMHIMSRDIFYFLKNLNDKFIEKFTQVKNELDYSILYLPTYRRVEEDLKNLGTAKQNKYENEYLRVENTQLELSDELLIHFGMDDVKQRIENIKNDIKVSTVVGFSKATADMLSQLLKGFNKLIENDINDLDDNITRIIIHRVGNNLSHSDRDSLLQLLENKKELKKNKELVYFIKKLIEVYKDHQHLDDRMKNFKDVCNRYLNDKQYIYDERSIDLQIYRNSTTDIVDLNMLSSGEKQIISIFSRIYLEEKRNLIVLFDEPELSLSLPWQKNLLPDIYNSQQCKFLLAVTHSPFIFDNELDKYAVSMSDHITETKTNEHSIFRKTKK